MYKLVFFTDRFRIRFSSSLSVFVISITVRVCDRGNNTAVGRLNKKKWNNLNISTCIFYFEWNNHSVFGSDCRINGEFPWKNSFNENKTSSCILISIFNITLLSLFSSKITPKHLFLSPSFPPSLSLPFLSLTSADSWRWVWGIGGEESEWNDKSSPLISLLLVKVHLKLQLGSGRLVCGKEME